MSQTKKHGARACEEKKKKRGSNSSAFYGKRDQSSLPRPDKGERRELVHFYAGKEKRGGNPRKRCHHDMESSFNSQEKKEKRKSFIVAGRPKRFMVKERTNPTKSTLL